MGGGPATLMDRIGQTALGRIAAGVEVTIAAWLPHRESTSYLVALPDGPEQGWLQTANLQAKPRPQVRSAVVAVASAAPKPRTTKKRAVGVVGAAARRTRTAAKAGQ